MNCGLGRPNSYTDISPQFGFMDRITNPYAPKPPKRIAQHALDEGCSRGSPRSGDEPGMRTFMSFWQWRPTPNHSRCGGKETNLFKPSHYCGSRGGEFWQHGVTSFNVFQVPNVTHHHSIGLTITRLSLTARTRFTFLVIILYRITNHQRPFSTEQGQPRRGNVTPGRKQTT